MIGSSDQLIEKVLDAHQALGLDRFLGQIDWGGLPRAAVEESISRYAEEIATAVRAATPTAPMPHDPSAPPAPPPSTPSSLASPS